MSFYILHSFFLEMIMFKLFESWHIHKFLKNYLFKCEIREKHYCAVARSNHGAIVKIPPPMSQSATTFAVARLLRS